MSLRSAYQDRLARGELRADPGQHAGVEALGRLEGELNAAGEPGFALFRKRPKAVRGVYLWGPVGRGKSMLMDLFFAGAPVERRRRAHFHAFMAEVHADVAVWRSGDAERRKARFGHSRGGDDPIQPVAERIASEARLLCFDELQVTDIADAMILGRLFEALFARGVTLVATSNRAPDDLYRDGLNRQLFLPFIAMLRERCEVIPVAGPTDFRLARLRGLEVWFAPADADNARRFDALWADQLDGATETGGAVEVLGRKLTFPRAAGGLLRTDFEALCGRPLGPQDYLAVARQFHTVFLSGVPRLTPDRRDVAKRFVTLVDALYEAHAELVTLAAAQPADLYPVGDGAFEFQRTVSRLEEMRSADWLKRRMEVKA